MKMIIFPLLAVLILIAGCSENHEDKLEGFEIGVHELEDRLEDNPNAILLDVREPEEFEEEHIDGSLLLPLGDISQKNLELLGIEKDHEVLLYCRSGRRSAQAYQILNTLGYTNVKSLAGGIIHWKEDGMSVSDGAYKGPSIPSSSAADGAIAEQPEKEFDFGQIPQFGGAVKHAFELINIGNNSLDIGDISTSCGCTTAEIDKNKILPGEKGIITVVFDPDLHEEPLDKFSRTIFVPTNDPVNAELEYRIWVDILEGK